MVKRTDKPSGKALDPLNFHCLNVLQKASPKLRTAIIKNADTDLIDAISECCKNVLNSATDIPPATLKRLKSAKNDIRKLSNKHQSAKTRRKLIIQKGGFLQYLLPIAISTLSAILNRNHHD